MQPAQQSGLMTCEVDLSHLNKFSKPLSPNVLAEPSKSVNWEQVKLTDGGSPDVPPAARVARRLGTKQKIDELIPVASESTTLPSSVLSKHMFQNSKSIQFANTYDPSKAPG